MTFHTRAPRTVRLQDTRVYPDLPELCEPCKDIFTKELCDDCFQRRGDFARSKGMPEYMIPQLRPRIHRVKAEDQKNVTYIPVNKGTADEVIMEHLKRKQAVADVVLEKQAAGRARAAAKRA